MIQSPAQLRALLPAGCQSFFADDEYAEPTQEWITGKFYPWFWQMRTALGLRAYDRRNDCDNFARAAAQAAEDCHALTPATSDGARASALAVGEFWYTKDAGGAHAICCASIGGALIFFEPQNGDILKLSAKEISTCFFARF